MYKAGLLLLNENILESEIAAFLVLLKAKGETAEEIYGLVRALREKGIAVFEPYTRSNGQLRDGW